VFVFAARAHDRGVQCCCSGREVLAGVALVTDDGDVAAASDACEQFERDVSFAVLGAGQRQRPGGAVAGEQGVQPEAVEVAAVAGAVAVVSGVGEGVIQAAGAAAFDRFSGAAALDGGAVDEQQVVVITEAVTRELVDQRLDRLRQCFAALVQP
jgi:hypothetical protein